MKAAPVFENPEHYGFGVSAMKRVKICGKCGASQESARHICAQCGAELPAETLFQIYRRSHPHCPLCETIVADYMRFCPHCGKALRKERQEGRMDDLR